MDGLTWIAKKNIIKRPGRSAAMFLIAFILAFTVFAGTAVMASLNKGLSSFDDRMGADIMVVPYAVRSKVDIDTLATQGITGHYYVDGEIFNKIAAIEGAGAATWQYFVAELQTDLLEEPLYVIAFDPKTDFSVVPWSDGTGSGNIGNMDAVIGSDVKAIAGDTLELFGTVLTAEVKLQKTGTTYDRSVFVDMETAEALIEASGDEQLQEYAAANGRNSVSSILVNAARGYEVEDVLNYINIHFKKVVAVSAKAMNSGISGSLKTAAWTAKAVIAVIWAAGFLIMAAIHIMAAGERRKEYAVLRIVGASGEMLSRITILESLILSLAGSAAAIAAVFTLIPLFFGVMGSKLGLPLIMPDTGVIVIMAAAAAGVTIVSDMFFAGLTAFRICRTDTGLLLRSSE